MYEKKSCIYDIYKWMGVVGKYTGCFPLPGVYEKKEWSKWTKAFINYVIPTLNFTYLFYCFVYFFFYKANFEKTGSFADLLFQLVNITHYLHFFLCIVFNHFYLRRELVTYLRMHSKVDKLLLKPNKRRLKRFVSIFFVFLMAFFEVQEELQWIMENGWKEYFYYYYDYPYEIFRVPLISLTKSVIYSIAVHTHPYLMYICFQRVLKSAFDQLLVEIKENQRKTLSVEMRVKKMRKYTRLYGDLCELCTRLDRMVSPIMLSIFVKYYIHLPLRFAFVLYDVEWTDADTVLEIVSGFLVLFLVANMAYFTKKSHNEILPAIYSTFNPDEKTIKTELQNFSLQSTYFNKSFSASGFFKLDRELILANFHSLISQVVVFYKVWLEQK